MANNGATKDSPGDGVPVTDSSQQAQAQAYSKLLSDAFPPPPSAELIQAVESADLAGEIMATAARLQQLKRSEQSGSSQTVTVDNPGGGATVRPAPQPGDTTQRRGASSSAANYTGSNSYHDFPDHSQASPRYRSQDAPQYQPPQDLPRQNQPQFPDGYDSRQLERPRRLAGSDGLSGQVYEMRDLRYRSADHSSADALVYIPSGFDPSKPVHLVVYNHGHGSTVSSAFVDSEIGKQLDSAPPNTVLIMPEWQETAGAKNGRSGRFNDPGRFANMVNEIFTRTPGLQGKTLDDVDNISIIGHSAGYQPSETEIYKNGLGNKVTSVTLLDCLYDGTGFDSWIQDNIYDLSSGRKQFNNFFCGTNSASQAQARRVQAMLDRAGLPRSSMVADFSNSRYLLDTSDIANHGIVFKYSTISKDGRGAHSSMPNLYLGPVMVASNYTPPGNSAMG